jgi:hypothetical protein
MLVPDQERCTTPDTASHNREDEMHPYFTEQIAETRTAELQREAAKWNLYREHRASARPAARERRGWARKLRSGLRSRPAAA